MRARARVRDDARGPRSARPAGRALLGRGARPRARGGCCAACWALTQLLVQVQAPRRPVGERERARRRARAALPRRARDVRRVAAGRSRSRAVARWLAAAGARRALEAGACSRSAGSSRSRCCSSRSASSRRRRGSRSACPTPGGARPLAMATRERPSASTSPGSAPCSARRTRITASSATTRAATTPSAAAPGAAAAAAAPRRAQGGAGLDMSPAGTCACGRPRSPSTKLGATFLRTGSAFSGPAHRGRRLPARRRRSRRGNGYRGDDKPAAHSRPPLSSRAYGPQNVLAILLPQLHTETAQPPLNLPDPPVTAPSRAAGAPVVSATRMQSWRAWNAAKLPGRAVNRFVRGWVGERLTIEVHRTACVVTHPPGGERANSALVNAANERLAGARFRGRVLARALRRARRPRRRAVRDGRVLDGRRTRERVRRRAAPRAPRSRRRRRRALPRAARCSRRASRLREVRRRHHAVAPFYRPGEPRGAWAAPLRSAYVAAFDVAAEAALPTIAVPLLGGRARRRPRGRRGGAVAAEAAVGWRRGEAPSPARPDSRFAPDERRRARALRRARGAIADGGR